MKKLILINILLISVFCSLSGQEMLSDDIQLLSQVVEDTTEVKTYSAAKDNKNEVQLLLSGLFLGYKKLISSQDGSQCAFHQSCSEYALVSIKSKGLVIGAIQFFDRFTRCNTCSPYLYERNSESNKFEDPVDDE